MITEPIWITEAQVAELVSLPDALVALENGLRLEGSGKAQNISRAFGRWGDGSVMHCLGAMFPEAGFVGWKTWVITKAGGAVTYELFDAKTGKLLAIIEAMTLGQLRTAAMTGIATKWLSAASADSLAIVGIGRQALAQIAAINAVRKLRKVLVCSREPARREAFAERVSDALGIDAEPAVSIEAAVGRAAITTLVTRAAEPFLSASMLPQGAHLNAVGAILPTHAEFHEDVFGRVGMMAVDSVPDVRKNSREFITHFGDGDWSAVHSIASIVAGGCERASGIDLTLFKSMGMGISDLSIAAETYRRAVEQNVGKPLGLQKPAPIRWA